MTALNDELVNKPLLKWLNTHPKIKVIATFIVVLLFLAPATVGAVKLFNSGWRVSTIISSSQYGLLVTKNPLGEKTESQKVADALAPDKKPEPQFNSDCPIGWICSNFDEKDFSGWNEYSINQLNTRSVQVSTDSVYDNPPLFFRNSETKINFIVKLKVIPRSQTKANVVILWNDSWRCIIGESSYSKITCEGNYQDSKKIERIQKFLSTLNKKLVIEIKSSLSPSENKNKIQLSLNYIDTLGKKEDANFEWLFTLKTADIDVHKQLLGVGLIDPNKEKVEAEFRRLELLPTK